MSAGDHAREWGPAGHSSEEAAGPAALEGREWAGRLGSACVLDSHATPQVAPGCSQVAFERTWPTRPSAGRLLRPCGRLVCTPALPLGCPHPAPRAAAAGPVSLLVLSLLGWEALRHVCHHGLRCCHAALGAPSRTFPGQRRPLHPALATGLRGLWASAPSLAMEQVTAASTLWAEQACHCHGSHVVARCQLAKEVNTRWSRLTQLLMAVGTQEEVGTAG